MNAQDRFADLVQQLRGRPGVQPPGSGRGFGSSSLRVNGSIFAMLSGEHLVVKLPSHRVAALIGNGQGTPYHAGKARPMKQWLMVHDIDAWQPLAEEALRCAQAPTDAPGSGLGARLDVPEELMDRTRRCGARRPRGRSSR